MDSSLLLPVTLGLHLHPGVTGVVLLTTLSSLSIGERICTGFLTSIVRALIVLWGRLSPVFLSDSSISVETCEDSWRRAFGLMEKNLWVDVASLFSAPRVSHVSPHFSNGLKFSWILLTCPISSPALLPVSQCLRLKAPWKLLSFFRFQAS